MLLVLHLKVLKTFRCNFFNLCCLHSPLLEGCPQGGVVFFTATTTPAFSHPSEGGECHECYLLLNHNSSEVPPSLLGRVGEGLLYRYQLIRLYRYLFTVNHYFKVMTTLKRKTCFARMNGYLKHLVAEVYLKAIALPLLRYPWLKV